MMIKPNQIRSLTTLLVMCLCIIGQLSAQYFGQNKPRYRNFEFNVLESPNFEIYSYTDDRAYLLDITNQAETWYDMHVSVLNDTIKFKNPLIFYNNHADFQQTNVISGGIGVGTGGVTEGFKNRVIMPFAFTNQQTNHVLGHELVHAFQYNMILGGDSTNIQSFSNLPLWMVEGLAEYLSIGRLDPHTAMWMRDAVLQDDVPTIKQLNNPKYFPYRYGQSFWAVVTGLYGDDIITPLFKSTAKYGLQIAVPAVLGMTVDSLSQVYREQIKSYYGTFLQDREETFIGNRIISDENAGRMNISPVMSPNGRYVIFLSEKNIFSTDLFLADARSGEVLKKITSIVRDGHLDDLNFLESAGTWSPNSKEFAFVGFKKGRNVIVIKEALTGKTIKTHIPRDVPSISNPAWSPNGRQIVFSGMVDGQTDLYLYTLKTGQIRQLTNNRYAEIQPNWSSDGTRIAFATDELSLNEGRHHGKWTMNLAILDVASGAVENIDVFRGADNLNPNFDPEDNLYFLSDRDGFRNMYKYDTYTDSVYQMTDFLTGISGITKYSPAISASRRRDRVVYSHYYDNGYFIYKASGDEMLNKPVSRDVVAMSPGMLPVVGKPVNNQVQQNLRNMDAVEAERLIPVEDTKYKPRFKLDFASGSTGVGVGTGTIGTRTALAGGVLLAFSDMLGNNQLYTTIAMNGEVLDFGGAVQYLNRKNRIAWGAVLSHVPLRAGGVSYSFDSLNIGGSRFEVLREDIQILRIFQDELNLQAQLPFSKNTRLEAFGGLNYQFFRMDSYPNYYDPLTLRWIGQGNRERIDINRDEINVGGFVARKGFSFNAGAAFVGDNSRFGLTSPLNGYRYRVDITKYAGTYDYLSTNADGRVYQYLNPVSLAFRFQHYARYGRDADSFNRILIGWMGLVRGYDYNQIINRLDRGLNDDNNEGTFNNQLEIELARLSGSKFFLSSFEVRLPFTGPERLALIKSGLLFTDLAAFIDAGVAFEQFSHFSDGEEIVINDPINGLQRLNVKPQFAISAGIALRVNVFNALIVEPYYAWPLNGPGSGKGLFGFNFIPGW